MAGAATLTVDRPLLRTDDLVYGEDGAPKMDKETRLRFGETVMTHAMVFTAYDQPAGEELPTKWRVENSYAQLNGDKVCSHPLPAPPGSSGSWCSSLTG